MKMKLPSIFKNKEAKQPQPTLPSFRSYDTVSTRTLDSLLLEAANFSYDDEVQSIGSRVRLSERLFFEPVETSSILKESKKDEKIIKSPFNGSCVPLVMESNDPYLDFKNSMQEIIESEGIILWKDWDCLEELLGLYLRMNERMNRGFIVGAFVDLLLGFSTAASSAGTTAYYSTASSPSSLVQAGTTSETRKLKIRR